MNVRVHVRHMRALGYCLKGCRRFYREHGLDWGACLREGTKADELARLGDAMADRAVALAEAEAASDGDGEGAA
jgi:hypothetical protein